MISVAQFEIEHNVEVKHLVGIRPR